jgi:hypothetical protein
MQCTGEHVKLRFYFRAIKYVQIELRASFNSFLPLKHDVVSACHHKMDRFIATRVTTKHAKAIQQARLPQIHRGICALSYFSIYLLFRQSFQTVDKANDKKRIRQVKNIIIVFIFG